MEVIEALAFLRDHQPMPSDKDLDNQTIELYDEVRRLFLVNNEPECVPLLLNSFGDGSGFGIYQLIEDVISKYSIEEVLPHLKTTLRSDFRSVRYWNAQIASLFPSIELVDSLVELLDEDDFDIKYASLAAIGQIDNKKILVIIKDFLSKETDLELRELAQQIIDDIKN